VMAHHSGMALVAFTNILLDAPMRRRLMDDPRLRAHDLLLQQRTPQAVHLVDWRKREGAARLLARLEEANAANDTAGA
jgi:cyclic beta-1,2-glucan synthetase